MDVFSTDGRLISPLIVPIMWTLKNVAALLPLISRRPCDTRRMGGTSPL